MLQSALHANDLAWVAGWLINCIFQHCKSFNGNFFPMVVVFRKHRTGSHR